MMKDDSTKNSLLVTRVYTREDGHSAFEDVGAGHVPAAAASGAVIKSYPPGFALDFHPSPNRMFVVTLDGEAEVAVSSGSVRRFKRGDVVLYEDVAGRGHATKVTGPGERVVLSVDLED